MNALALLLLLIPALAQAATGTATHRHADLLTGQALFELGVCLDAGPCVPVSSGSTPDPQMIQEGDRVLVSTVQAMTTGRATTRYILTPLMVRTPKRLGAAPMAGVSGMHPALIIRVGWPGEAASTQAQAEATGQAVAAFFTANSYGRLTMTFDHVAVTLAQAPSGCPYSQIATQAEAAAKAGGVNPGAYLHLVYALPWRSSCGWAGLGTIGGAPSRAWINGIYITSPQVVAHELGHNLGLYHSNSMRCATGTVLTPPCTATEYGDYWDTMGSGNTMPFNAAQKHALGWLEAPVVTAGTVRLTPVETTPSAIQVPRGVGMTDTLFLEHRPTSATLLDPVLVHLRSTGTYLLRMGSQGWPLPAGAAWTVPGGGPTLRVDAADAAGAQVTVASVGTPSPPAGGTDLTQTFPAAPGLHTLGACARQVGGTSVVRIGQARAPIANPRQPFVMRCVTTPPSITLSINGVVKLTAPVAL